MSSGYLLRGRGERRAPSLQPLRDCMARTRHRCLPTYSFSPCSPSTCWGSKYTVWPLGGSEQNKVLALMSGLPFRWGRQERPAAHRRVRSVDGVRQRRGRERWGQVQEDMPCARQRWVVPGACVAGGAEPLSSISTQGLDGGWAGMRGLWEGPSLGLGVTAAGPTAPGPAALRGERRDVLGPGPAGRTHGPPGLLAHRDPHALRQAHQAGL